MMLSFSTAAIGASPPHAAPLRQLHRPQRQPLPRRLRGRGRGAGRQCGGDRHGDAAGPQALRQPDLLARAARTRTRAVGAARALEVGAGPCVSPTCTCKSTQEGRGGAGVWERRE